MQARAKRKRDSAQPQDRAQPSIKGYAVSNAVEDKHVSGSRYAEAVEAAQIDLLYEQAPSSLFATLVIGFLLTLGLWNAVSKTSISFWLAAVAVLSGGRYLLLTRYR